jgi:hypothetical protein
LPWILDFGGRGFLIDSDLETAVETIIMELNRGDAYLNAMSKRAQDWSQQYTVDRLEEEIKNIVRG